MLGMNTDFSLRMAVVAISLVLGFEVAGLAPAMFIATYGSSDNSSLLKVSDKNVSGTENDNVTTKGNVFLNQTKDTAGNQTVLAINSSNTTSANGSNVGMLTNPSEHPLAPLQPLRGLLPAPSQSQQQQPSNLQQQRPPLQSPLNLIPPRSSPLQQNPLSAHATFTATTPTYRWSIRPARPNARFSTTIHYDTSFFQSTISSPTISFCRI